MQVYFYTAQTQIKDALFEQGKAENGHCFCRSQPVGFGTDSVVLPSSFTAGKPVQTPAARSPSTLGFILKDYLHPALRYVSGRLILETVAG